MSLVYEQRVVPVKAWFNAYNARDVRELCALADPAIEIAPMRPLGQALVGTSFHGHDGVRTLMQWTFANYPRIFAEVIEVDDTPVWITAETLFIHDVEGMPASSRRTWSLFDVQDGSIRGIRAFASDEEARRAACRHAVLTPREREVFGLLARGMTSVQIAEELYLSPFTVRTHIRNAKDRLGAKTRMEALSIALKRGEISG
jgi:DNA-binding CsgD family transcriptional regulator